LEVVLSLDGSVVVLPNCRTTSSTTAGKPFLDGLAVVLPNRQQYNYWQNS
jgi:hypothetical protein